MSNYFESRLLFHKSRMKVWRAISEYLQPEIVKDAVVIDLGAGYCDFINHIKAGKKYAVDINPEAVKYCNKDVEFINASVTDLNFQENSVDVVFASNLMEHLTDDILDQLYNSLNKILKKNGKIILIQPNYHYCYREYWDDFTHVKAFSHISLAGFLKSKDFEIARLIPRFLPFTFYSIFPKSYWLTKIYLALPYHPLAKQMLVIAAKTS